MSKQQLPSLPISRAKNAVIKFLLKFRKVRYLQGTTIQIKTLFNRVYYAKEK